jgi:hypothetical protein
MIVDPYARRSVKLSDMENMEREREMARQRKWVATQDKKRKEKIQAYRMALAYTEAQIRKHERVKKRFMEFKDRVLAFILSRNIDRMKHRNQQQKHREWLASRDTFGTFEDSDDYDLLFGDE